MSSKAVSLRMSNRLIPRAEPIGRILPALAPGLERADKVIKATIRA